MSGGQADRGGSFFVENGGLSGSLFFLGTKKAKCMSKTVGGGGLHEEKDRKKRNTTHVKRLNCVWLMRCVYTLLPIIRFKSVFMIMDCGLWISRSRGLGEGLLHKKIVGSDWGRFTMGGSFHD